MKRSFLVIFLLFALVATNCNKTDDLSKKEICKQYTETYIYHNNKFAFDFTVYSDESVEMMGDTTSADFKTIVNVMQKTDFSILTFSDQDGIIYLFDSRSDKEEYLKGIRRDLSDNAKSTETWHPLYIICYFNPGFDSIMFDGSDPDDKITPTHYNLGNWDGFPSLAYVNGIDFDDEMSSIQILNYTGMEAEIVLFSDASFSGYNWTIYVRPSSVNGYGDSNKDNGYHGNPTASLSDFSERTMYYTLKLFRHDWDNKVSSIKWRTIDCVGECSSYLLE
jgi:hypothetical protein